MQTGQFTEIMNIRLGQLCTEVGIIAEYLNMPRARIDASNNAALEYALESSYPEICKLGACLIAKCNERGCQLGFPSYKAYELYQRSLDYGFDPFDAFRGAVDTETLPDYNAGFYKRVRRIKAEMESAVQLVFLLFRLALLDDSDDMVSFLSNKSNGPVMLINYYNLLIGISRAGDRYPEEFWFCPINRAEAYTPAPLALTNFDGEMYKYQPFEAISSTYPNDGKMSNLELYSICGVRGQLFEIGEPSISYVIREIISDWIDLQLQRR